MSIYVDTYLNIVIKQEFSIVNQELNIQFPTVKGATLQQILTWKQLLAQIKKISLVFSSKNFT